MSWYERPYSGFGGGPRFTDNPLMWAPTIGHVAGIRIRVHMLFILYVFFELLGSGRFFLDRTHLLFVLFGSVFLHELGHCFTARRVGGHADDVLMWPLGGLASVDAPRAPWPQFLVAAGGPAVTVLLFVVSGALLWLGVGDRVYTLNPFTLGDDFGQSWGDLHVWLSRVYHVNMVLFLFNLWPMYPMDGGRILQCGLWWKVGYRRSMSAATSVGMVAAIVMGFWALIWGAHEGGIAQINFNMLFVAVMGYMFCLQQRQLLAAGYDEEFGGMGYSESTSGTATRREGWISRWRRQRAEARQRREDASEKAEMVEVDRILAKVHEQGMASLTPSEKRTLTLATERERRRRESASGRR